MWNLTLYMRFDLWEYWWGVQNQSLFLLVLIVFKFEFAHIMLSIDSFMYVKSSYLSFTWNVLNQAVISFPY